MPESTASQPLDRLLRLALAGVAVLFAAHLALAPMEETDLFFHLKLGQVILATRSIPFRNLFSFTYPDHPDPDLAWAFQVAMALLFRAGGFPAIVLAKAVLVTASAALLFAVCRRSGAGAATSSLVTVVALLAAQQRLVERPHLVTWLGLAALQLLLVEIEHGRRGLRWAIPPLALAWANFHAGVFLLPVLLALRAVGSWLDVRLPARVPSSGDGEPGAANAGVGAPAALLATAACLATPAGIRLLTYLAWHTGLGATRIIEEFRRADPWDDPWFFVLLAGVVLAHLRLGREVRWRHALPVLVVAVLAWRSVRFVAEWAFLAAPLVARGLAGFARTLGEPRIDPAIAPFRRERWRRALQLGLAAAIAGDVAWERRGQPLDIGLAADVVPFDAIEFVTRNGLRERLYHDLDVGCYLLWEGWPRYRVFQDARLPAYPDAFHRALDQTPLAPAAFDALLRRYDVDAALINYPGINMRAGSFDPEEWALVYDSDEALVFARRIPRHEPLIARDELPVRIRFNMATGSSRERIPSPPPRSPLGREEWERRLARLGR